VTKRQLEMISIVKDIEEISIERMDVTDFGEPIDDG
jgi:hypothetical protein